MKHTFISDTHGLTKNLKIDTDVLHICGDVMNGGRDAQELIDFVDWLSKQRYDRCIIVPGNHDGLFQTDEDHARSIVEPYATVLIDQSTKVGGLNVYGSPWTPEFCDWWFMLPKYSNDIALKWQAIPSSTDILLTHCPPIHVMDDGLGEYGLWIEVTRRVKPKVHAFGHIHKPHGLHLDKEILSVNCAVCNERHRPVNAPVTVEIPS